MNFSLEESICLLERTPRVLTTWLNDLPAGWTTPNEGPETWSVYDVVGHLIHGEKTDWIPRLDIILSDRHDKTFEPFDRFAQMAPGKKPSLNELLQEFAQRRSQNLLYLKSKNLTSADLHKKGVHPALGEVSLAQLLATWAVHDLNHLAQISRVMAKQYRSEVGPWIEYLKILQL